MADPSQRWRADRLYAPVYAAALDRPALARVAGALLLGTDLRHLYDTLAVVAQQPDGAAILDVPCGGGVALRGLSPGQRVRYVAADIAPAMLARTRQVAHRRGLEDAVETTEADMGALPFADGEFDLCLSLTGLHCVPDARRALAELCRVLAPGGTLALSLWCSDVSLARRPHRRAAQLSGLVGPSASEAELRRWLPGFGVVIANVRRSGDFLYLQGARS